MYKDTLMMNPRTSSVIDECLNRVHPGLRAKKDCKNILGIISKIFTQQLIEESM